VRAGFIHTDVAFGVHRFDWVGLGLIRHRFRPWRPWCPLFGQSIEPVHQRLAGAAVIEALVKLVADGPGQPADFSISCFHNCGSSFVFSVARGMAD
jgi:hypothetical protein